VKTIELDKAAETLVEYARDMSEGPAILTIAGKPVAALVAIEGVDLETLSLSTHPQFTALIERSRARLQAEGGISSEEMRRRLGRGG
jgi:hypothetical protein